MSVTIEQHPNTIPEVIIGTQIWAAQNYDFGGTYPGNLESNVTDYGRLYTWAEAMAIDYPGWHLPTNTEFQTLITYLGGASVAGGYLKESGTTNWTTPNTGADNSSGFTARASGYNESNMGTHTYFWTSSDSGTDAYSKLLTNTAASVGTYVMSKSYRFSVRLIKD
jgi:uncharacterized protein (TIGR02145 family)